MLYCNQYVQQISLGMSRKVHRVKSDTLYRLCKLISEGTYSRLKAYNDVYAKGSQQWQLFEYYRNLDTWSRDKEKNHWQHLDLADLKYNTLARLLRAISKMGDWPGHEIHALIGDIAWAIKHGAGEEMLPLIDEAKNSAIQTERLGLLMEILGLEKQAVFQLTSATKRVARMKAIQAQTRWMLERIAEIEKLNTLRIALFEPAKGIAQEQGVASTQYAELLEVELDRINGEEIIAQKALLEFHILSLWTKTVQASYQAAALHSDKIGQIYDANPWLVQDDLHRFFQILKSRVAVHVFAGQMKKATNLLAAFDGWPLKTAIANGTIAKVEAYFRVYDVSKNKSIGERALLEYSVIRQQIEGIEIEQRVWLLFFTAKTSLLLGNFILAEDALELILRNKSGMEKRMHYFTRIMLLLCYLGLGKEHDLIHSSAIAASKFLNRGAEVPPVLLTVVKTILGLIRHPLSQGQFSNISVRELEEIKMSHCQSPNANAITFDFYEWFLSFQNQVISHP